MRSRMRHQVSIFVCIVVLAAVKLSQSIEPIRLDNPRAFEKHSVENTERSRHMPIPKDGDTEPIRVEDPRDFKRESIRNSERIQFMPNPEEEGTELMQVENPRDFKKHLIKNSKRRPSTPISLQEDTKRRRVENPKNSKKSTTNRAGNKRRPSTPIPRQGGTKATRKENSENANKSSIENIKRPEMKLAPKKGFLVGEDTPVWTSSKLDKGSPVVYSKLQKDFMKRALIDWRRINGSVNAQAKPSEKTVHEPSTNSSTELHISILVVMDMKMAKNSENNSTVTIMEYERLLRYAVSFLNTVDDRLRSIDSDISLYLSGVIIGKNREATEYISRCLDKYGTFTEQLAVMFMHKNLTRLLGTNKRLLGDEYDFVVTITDIKPKEITPVNLDDNRLLKMAKKSYKILTFLVIDDGMFSGVRSIADKFLAVISELRLLDVEKVATVHSGLEQERPAYYKLEHLAINITRFRDGLSKPKYSYHPSKSLETRLFRDISDKQEQCMAHALNYEKSCWNPMKCDKLICRNEKSCQGIGPAKDGTTCGIDRMCIDGKCVSKANPKYN